MDTDIEIVGRILQCYSCMLPSRCTATLARHLSDLFPSLHLPLLRLPPYSKEYFEFKIASPRAVVEPSLADKILMPHSEYLKKAKVVVGVVKGLKDNEVELEDGTTVPFDYLILATGSKIHPAFNHPAKEDRVKFIQDRECRYVPME